MIIRRSLFLKYAVPLVILVAGALIISGLVQIYFSYHENKDALAKLQREKALSAAMRIEQFVREVEHQLEWIAQTPWGARGVPIEQRRLDSLRLLRHVPAVTEVTHIDPTGKEKLRVSRLAMDVLASRDTQLAALQFQEAKARKAYFGSVYFRKESEPYMTIALAGNGEEGGVIVSETNLKFIWDVVAALKVGKAGYSYVVDAEGRLIAHPDISLVLQKTDFRSLPQVAPVIAKTSRAAVDGLEAEIGRNIRGGEVLSAHASIEPLGWHVYVDVPIDEAYEPIIFSAIRTVGLVIIGLGVSILAALFLVRRMVSPIHILQAGAARIGTGDLDQRIDVTTGDELQELAEEFNRMSGQLQESYAGLERKVEERTRDLSQALERQTATSEVLRAISSSPTNLQPILDILVERAARLCGAADAQLFLAENDHMREVATFGRMKRISSEVPLPVTRGTINGRTILERRVTLVSDTALESYRQQFPMATEFWDRFGDRPP